MKWLMTLVGTSALTNERVGCAPDGRDNRRLRNQVITYLSARDKDPRRWKQMKDELAAAHRRYWDKDDKYTSSAANYFETAAELTSTWAILTKSDLPFDRLALLATDTPECLLAAEIVEQVMQDFMVKKLATQHVDVVKVEGLNVSFKDPVNRLRKVMEDLLRVGEGDEVDFNITAGYKATVAAVTMLAIERVEGQQRTSNLYYQNDSASDIAILKLVGQSKPEEVAESANWKPWREHYATLGQR